MSNYTKSPITKQNQNDSGFFVGSKSPYLTITNKSTSNLTTTPVKPTPETYRKDPEYIRKLSRDLAFDFNHTSAIQFNERIRRGWVKIKRINDNELAVYRVPNSHGFSGRPTASNEGIASNSTKSRFTARNRLVEIIKANTDFCFFFTGTFDPKRWDRTNFRELHNSLTRWLRRRGIKYILIPEPHKDGSIHFHGLFNETIVPFLTEFNLKQKLPKKITDRIKDGHLVFDCPDYAKMFGWVSIERIRSFEATANYVSKYVSKSFDNQNARFSYHRYFCSKGLKRPEFILKPNKSYSNYEQICSSYIPKVVFKRRAGGVGTVPPRVEAPPDSIGSQLALNSPQNFSL